MIKTYDKNAGERSIRIEAEYRCNEAGAKQYIQDELKKLIELIESPTRINSYLLQMQASRIYGHMQVLTSFGLLSIFDFHQFKCELGEMLINSLMIQLHIEPQI